MTRVNGHGGHHSESNVAELVVRLGDSRRKGFVLNGADGDFEAIGGDGVRNGTVVYLCFCCDNVQ